MPQATLRCRPREQFVSNPGSQPNPPPHPPETPRPHSASTLDHPLMEGISRVAVHTAGAGEPCLCRMAWWWKDSSTFMVENSSSKSRDVMLLPTSNALANDSKSACGHTVPGGECMRMPVHSGG